MISEAARAASHAKITVLCADCGTHLQRPVCAAWRPAVCGACQKKRHAAHKRKMRATVPMVNRAPAKRLVSFYLTLTDCPDDSWPCGHRLLRREWDALVRAGDLSGARFVDSGGRAWAAVGGEIVAA